MEPINELASEDVKEFTPSKKPIGRKFIISLITVLIGALTIVSNVLQNGDALVSVIGLAVALLSSVSYVVTEGKLDLESMKTIIDQTEDLIDGIEDAGKLFTEDYDKQEES